MLKKAITLLGVLISLTASAASLTFYEQPDEKAKVAFTLETGEALIPIIEKEHWLKVANPKDGNVGWIKTEAFKDNKASKVYRYVEYRGMDKLKPEEVDKLMAQLQQRQAMFERHMQLIMQSMFNDMQAMHRMDPFWDYGLAPVLIIKEKATENTKPEAKVTETHKPSTIEKIKEKLFSEKSKS